MSLLDNFNRHEALFQIEHGLGSMDDRGLAMTMWAIYEKAYGDSFGKAIAKLSDEDLAEVIAGMIGDEAEIELEEVFAEGTTEDDVLSEFGCKPEDEDDEE